MRETLDATREHYVSRKVDLRNASVLVVDADEEVRGFTSSICRTLRFGTILGAANVNHAFELLISEKVDLLLCGWGAAPLACADFVKKLRASKVIPNNAVPVIVLTSHSGQEAVKEARDAGVDDFISRPMAMTRLLNSFLSVLCMPRTYVRCESYTGPCRRRRRMPFSSERRSAWRGERLLPSSAVLHKANENQPGF